MTTKILAIRSAGANAAGQLHQVVTVEKSSTGRRSFRMKPCGGCPRLCDKPNGFTNNIDILITGASIGGVHKIAIELKCYRKTTASGRPRGANDIFMRDVYEDLQVLENYVKSGVAQRGVALVMNDAESFVQPVSKVAKAWAYDLSDGHTFAGGVINVPVGGREVHIELSKAYTFTWARAGDFWFMELEGRDRKAVQ